MTDSKDPNKVAPEDSDTVEDKLPDFNPLDKPADHLADDRDVDKDDDNDRDSEPVEGEIVDADIVEDQPSSSELENVAESEVPPAAAAPPKKAARWPWAVAALVLAFVAGLVTWPFIIPKIAPQFSMVPTKSDVADLEARLAELEQARGGGEVDAALKGTEEKISGLAESVSGLQESTAALAKQSDLAALGERLDQIESQSADSGSNGGGAEAVNEKIAALETAIAKLREGSSAGGDTSGSGNDAGSAAAPDQRVEAIAGRLEQIESQIVMAATGSGDGANGNASAMLADRLADLETKLSELGTGNGGGDLTAMTERVNALSAQVEEMLSAGLDEKLAGVESSMAETKTELAALADTLQGQNEQLASLTAESTAKKGDARDTGLILAIDQLHNAAQGSGGFAGEIETVQALGADHPELETLSELSAEGAPSLDDLAAAFPAVANAAVRGSVVPDSDDWLNRTVGRLSSIVSVRRVGDVEGDGVAAVVARAEQRLKEMDLPAAVTELAALEGTPAEAVADWLAGANKRLAIDDAIGKLKTRIISQLGGATTN